MRVLVVEDEPLLAQAIRDGLRLAAIAADLAGDGDTALEMLAVNAYDLAVLDRDIPGPSGDDIARHVVASGTGMPILMLTAADRLGDKASGFELGADDYLTKPFSPRELVLRVGAVLRRGSPSPAPGALRDGDLVVDLAAREACREDRPLALTLREFDLLAFLMRHPREAFDRAALLSSVWGWSFGDASTVTVHVRRLREKVERDPTMPARLVTVWGVGYRWEPQEVGS
jgi:DNA-binding response OmpR family regulator